MVVTGGEPVLYFEATSNRLWSFAAAEAERVGRALAALDAAALAAPRHAIRVETMDGESVRRSDHYRAFREAGFEEDPRGLVLEARAGRPERR